MLHCLTDQDHSKDVLPPLLSEDISPEGIFVRTTKALDVNSHILLRLHLPTMTKPFSCVARVARVERRRNGEVRGVGLQFLDLAEEHRQLLVEHLYRSYQVQHVGD